MPPATTKLIAWQPIRWASGWRIRLSIGRMVDRPVKLDAIPLKWRRYVYNKIKLSVFKQMCNSRCQSLRWCSLHSKFDDQSFSDYCRDWWFAEVNPPHETLMKLYWKRMSNLAVVSHTAFKDSGNSKYDNRAWLGLLLFHLGTQKLTSTYYILNCDMMTAHKTMSQTWVMFIQMIRAPMIIRDFD